jgi:AraC-like DNA-binding protein
MDQSEMEELLVFPQEIPLHEALFENSPLFIAKKYLECFDSGGSQVRRVPRYILEALAKRFLMLMNGDCMTLDDAFGGGVRRQRNRMSEADRQFEVCWAIKTARDEIRRQSPMERGPGTPFEIAIERVAEDLGMSPDNVRRIHKAAGAR